MAIASCWLTCPYQYKRWFYVHSLSLLPPSGQKSANVGLKIGCLLVWLNVEQLLFCVCFSCLLNFGLSICTSLNFKFQSQSFLGKVGKAARWPEKHMFNSVLSQSLLIHVHVSHQSVFEQDTEASVCEWGDKFDKKTFCCQYWCMYWCTKYCVLLSVWSAKICFHLCTYIMNSMFEPISVTLVPFFLSLP